MARYRKKPVVIDAVRWDGNVRTAESFMDCEFSIDDRTRALFIPTREGEMRGDQGDWIIRGVAGEFYPCKPDIFDATYEPAD